MKYLLVDGDYQGTDATAHETAMSGQATTSSPSSGWGQFSLRALMVGMTAFCVLCAMLAVPPMLALTCGVTYVLLSGALAATIWLGRGWIRAFSVGAILPHIAGYLVVPNVSGPIEFVIAAFLLTFLAALAGTGSASLHGFLARRGGVLPVPNLPFIRDWFTNDWHT